MEPVHRLLQATIMTAVSVIVMNVIGSYVSAIGAGMACPEWPLCPFPESYPVLMEFLHRAWGLVVITLIVVSVFRARRVDALKELRFAKMLVYMSLLVVMIQVGLGAIVVYSGLRPEFVALHQLLAQLVLSLQLIAAGISWSTTIAAKRGQASSPQ